jgi:dTDP-4-amino-4,6-dideoxygalactose transaminase
LEEWHEARRRAARSYNKLFQGSQVVTPYEAPFARHIFHQYTLRLKSRDAVVQHLAERKVPHAIYYPIPLHLQQAYAGVGGTRGSFPITEQAAAEVLSLPMHTELTEEQQQYVVAAVREALPD